MYDKEPIKPEENQGRPLPMLAAIEIIAHIRSGGYRLTSIAFKLGQAERDLQLARHVLNRKDADQSIILAEITQLFIEIEQLKKTHVITQSAT